MKPFENIEVDLGLLFSLLRAEMFVTIEGNYCCGSCSLAVIPDTTKRYAFYHKQDLETLKERGVLYVSYGGTDSNEKIADIIVHKAGYIGIPVIWDGNLNTRIKLVFYNS